METFTEIKEFVENPGYPDQRQRALAGLSDDMIDDPIIDLINGFNRLPYCFTIQCCYGHFRYNPQQDRYNCDPLPISDTIEKVDYRIAYICFCIENSVSGRGLFGALNKTTTIDPDYIQFCCAEWFWERQVNSYSLQVQPDRFKHQDSAILDYQEALHVEKIRNQFWDRLRELVRVTAWAIFRRSYKGRLS